MRTASPIVILALLGLLFVTPAHSQDDPEDEEQTTPAEPVEVVDYLAATGMDPTQQAAGTPDRAPPAVDMVVRGSCPTEAVLGMLGDLPAAVGRCLASGPAMGLDGAHDLSLSWRHDPTGALSRLQLDSASTPDDHLTGCAFAAVEELRLESAPRSACWVILELTVEFEEEESGPSPSAP